MAEHTARLYAEKKWGKRLIVEKGCMQFLPEREQELHIPQSELPKQRQGLSR